jgi:hypothetical protein
MKKTIMLMLMMLLVLSGFGLTANQEPAKEQKQAPAFDVVIRTYSLNYVSPQMVCDTLRHYLRECSFDRRGNMLTVRIDRKNIPRFEELLKQMDVEKKKILFRIFTVIASQENKSSDIQNKDLQQVLEELKRILSFKSFRLDGVSAITVTDGQRYSQLQLSSHSPLILELMEISIKGEKPGDNIISFQFELKQKVEPPVLKEGKLLYQTLIESETSVKENGFLVAGVSKIGNGDSLVLVINAEIK